MNTSNFADNCGKPAQLHSQLYLPIVAVKSFDVILLLFLDLDIFVQCFKIHLEWCKICHSEGFSESSFSPVAQEGCTELIRSFGWELWTSFAVSKSSWYSQVRHDLSCNITIMSLLAVGPAWGFPLRMIVTTECCMIILGTQDDIYDHYGHVTTFLFLIHHSQVHQVILLL